MDNGTRGTDGVKGGGMRRKKSDETGESLRRSFAEEGMTTLGCPTSQGSTIRRAVRGKPASPFESERGTKDKPEYKAEG